MRIPRSLPPGCHIVPEDLCPPTEGKQGEIIHSSHFSGSVSSFEASHLAIDIIRCLGLDQELSWLSRIVYPINLSMFVQDFTIWVNCSPWQLAFLAIGILQAGFNYVPS